MSSEPLTLQQYLAVAGLTQAQFAALIPTRQDNVSRWCSGVIPQREHRKRISEVTDGRVPAFVWFRDEDAA